MPPCNNHIAGKSFQTFDTEDMTDDSTNTIPTLGLTMTLRLRDRFRSRLSRLVTATVDLNEHQDQTSMIISVSRREYPDQPRLKLDDDLRDFVKIMEHNMSLISRYVDEGIMRIFRACQDAFADFMTLYLGIEDIPDGRSKLDPFPKYAYHTFVRAAEACPAFSVLEFHLSPPAPSSKRLQSAKIAKTSASSNSHCSTLAAVSGQSAMTADRTTESKSCVNLAPPPTELPQTISRPLSGLYNDNRATEHDSILAAIYPFIGERQPSAEHTSLWNRSDQDTVHLLAAVLLGNLLQVSSDAWFTFGFVATRDQEEERHLGGLYAAILKEAQKPQVIFRELKDAHQNDTLTNLFDSMAYGQFRQQFLRLENFLKTPSAARSTVWRLIQYTRCDGYKEPSPVIKRDFGFQLCRNHQDVMLLKDAYTHILANAGLRDLHNACRFGRLAEFAQMSGVPNHAKKRHLFTNDYPSPFIGFDNGKGLERHCLPLFKSSKKM
ncbi:hypothetical protein BKA63DRAFT_576318 [Paraphoma chrysanthemicola]|nr:hypothetical protein BKA63DRAFT_576318 [Paraphoma chrysanthemicola]